MADYTNVKALEEICESIIQLASEKEKYIRRADWGVITFEEIESDIETVLWLVQEIKALPIDIIDDGAASNTTSHLTQIRENLREIDVFSVEHGDPSSTRTNIISNMKNGVQNAVSTIGFWIPLLALRAGKIQNWNAQMKGDRNNMAELLREAATHSEERKNEIDAAVAAARAAAGEAGAAEFTHEFRREAETAEKRGKWWLVPTGIFAASSLGLAAALISGLFGETPANLWDAIYRLGGRVIAISVLFYAAIWSGRIVLANLHLASVNKHRAISLQTLQAFHRAAADEAAKDAVVLEAARAVYENVPSGYIARQGGGPGGNARTLEVIKSAVQRPRSDGEG